MIVEILTTQNSLGFTRQELFVNGKEYVTIKDLSESPEDAIIGRDLVDANDIANYIQMGFDAAKRGEELQITEL